LETFIEPKQLQDNPKFIKQKPKSLAGLSDAMIDEPIIKIVNNFNKRPYCFTLQSCFGHFLYSGQNDPYNVDPIPLGRSINTIEYRIAYLAFCIENSEPGRNFLNALKELTFIDLQNIQFCSAEWFWKRQLNSYALQVEPDRFKDKDTAILGYHEALQVEKVRNEFFLQLKTLLQKQSD
jgi:hypothetical protein